MKVKHMITGQVHLDLPKRCVLMNFDMVGKSENITCNEM